MLIKVKISYPQEGFLFALAIDFFLNTQTLMFKKGTGMLDMVKIKRRQIPHFTLKLTAKMLKLLSKTKEKI